VLDLGIWFDEKLSFREHTHAKIDKSIHDAWDNYK